MNAAEQVRSVAFANALASALNLVRQHFPEASANLTPWRDDPETRRWVEEETIDIAFHFPGWSPRLQCRSLLIQLKITNAEAKPLPCLLGVIMRGVTFDGERWQLATVGDWQPTGSHLPQPAEREQLHQICRELFVLFPFASMSDELE